MRDALVDIWATVAMMAPWLLLGLLIAGFMSVFLPVSWVRRHMGGTGLWANVKAAAIGIPLPVCSCGIVPLVAGLRRRGASAAASMSFLIATPQTSVDSIVLCAVLIGPWFALFSPVAALVAAMIGGLLVHEVAVATHQPVQNVSSRCSEQQAEATDAALCPAAEAVATATPPAIAEEPHTGPWLLRVLKAAGIDVPREIGREMAIGILIAGIIAALVPQSVLATWGGTGLSPKLVMLLAGIPLYVCSASSVPIAAALIAKGVAPGSALVFLLAGPATNAATVMAVRKLLGTRSVVIYLAAVTAVAVGFGLALDALGTVIELDAASEYMGHGVSPLQHVAGVAVTLVLLGAFIPRWSGHAACCNAEAKHAEAIDTDPVDGRAQTDQAQPGAPTQAADPGPPGDSCPHCR
ncbi:MAG: SO_0444 family Cu/Zn efflux transporter [Planctomycetota bacterium]